MPPTTCQKKMPFQTSFGGSNFNIPNSVSSLPFLFLISAFPAEKIQLLPT